LAGSGRGEGGKGTMIGQQSALGEGASVSSMVKFSKKKLREKKQAISSVKEQW